MKLLLAGVAALSLAAQALALPLKTRTQAGPEQLHLALGKTPDEMTVSWVTENPFAISEVSYGLSAHALDQKAVGRTTQYTMQAVPRNTTAGFVTYTSDKIHHCPLTGLAAGQLYFYQPAGATAVYNFTTLPAVGQTAKPFAFIAIGDLGQTPDSVKTVAHAMQDKDAQIILHAGDMAYADCAEKRWDSYFAMIQPLAQRLPWMVCGGNHEIEPNNLTGHIMDPYKHRYAMPEVAPTVDTTQYFQSVDQNGFDCTPSAFTGSFDFGNSFYSTKAAGMHVIFLNSFTGTDVDSPQFKWLKQELLSVDRLLTPWLIVVWHSPWYNSNDSHHDEFNVVAMRASMEGLLLGARVNFVLSGHVHAYERSHPVANNLTDSKVGITYFNIGDGGNREGHSLTFLQQPAWSAFRDGTDFGHSKVTLHNATHATWQWHKNNADEWTVGDEVVIVNQVHDAL